MFHVVIKRPWREDTERTVLLRPPGSMAALTALVARVYPALSVWRQVVTVDGRLVHPAYYGAPLSPTVPQGSRVHVSVGLPSTTCIVCGDTGPQGVLHTAEECPFLHREFQVVVHPVQRFVIGCARGTPFILNVRALDTITRVKQQCYYELDLHHDFAASNVLNVQVLVHHNKVLLDSSTCIDNGIIGGKMFQCLDERPAVYLVLQCRPPGSGCRSNTDA